MASAARLIGAGQLVVTESDMPPRYRCIRKLSWARSMAEDDGRWKVVWPWNNREEWTVADAPIAPGPLIFDRALLRRRRRRAAALGPAHFLLNRVADDLADRLAAVTRRFELALDLGTPGEAVRAALADLGAIGTMARADAIAPEGPQNSMEFIVADEELLPVGDGTLDLVVSALALQFVNDLPGVFIQIRRALKADGLFLGALLGGETLTELRQSFAAAESEVERGVSPRVAPFADLRELGALLQRAEFALPVTDVDRLTVRYASAFDLMHDLRRMGATNALIARRRTPLRRATLMRMAEIYRQRFADSDGRVRATFEIVWLSGWAPHPDQQKPLKPGSAQARLADVLGAREISAGEKAGE
jgi:SAM-dependent methyltransferase